MILVCHLQKAGAAAKLWWARLLRLASLGPSISDWEGSPLRTRTVEATTRGPRWPLAVLLHGANCTIDHTIRAAASGSARAFSARAPSIGGGGEGQGKSLVHGLQRSNWISVQTGNRCWRATNCRSRSLRKNTAAIWLLGLGEAGTY